MHPPLAKPASRSRTGLIAALDVGSTKTCCLIARRDGAGRVEILGAGYKQSQGMRAGTVVDMAAVEATIKATVQAAEDMADETVERVVVNVSTPHPTARLRKVETATHGRRIGDADVARMLAMARESHDSQGGELIHFMPRGYRVDQADGVGDPRGMWAENLGLEALLVSAEPGPVRNLIACVRRSVLDLEALVVSPFAAAEAVVDEEARALGVTVIDMGGGTTGVAVLDEGQALFADTIPIGGHHVTMDIAKILGVPVRSAERLKTIHANCIASQSDRKTELVVPPAGDDEPDGDRSQTVNLEKLNQIVQARVAETIAMVATSLRDAGVLHQGGGTVLLTGGAAQIQGITDLAAPLLGRKVRLTDSVSLAGLPEAFKGPAFATCAGLLAFTGEERGHPRMAALAAAEGNRGMVGRLGAWLRACW